MRNVRYLNFRFEAYSALARILARNESNTPLPDPSEYQMMDPSTSIRAKSRPLVIRAFGAHCQLQPLPAFPDCIDYGITLD